MFDDPNKDLKWLEEQLLAEEEPETEEDWLEEELRSAYDLMNNDYSHPARQQVSLYDYDAEADDEGDVALYADAPQPPVSQKKAKKEKGVGGLVFLACLETLGILAVLLWWVLWLM